MQLVSLKGGARWSSTQKIRLELRHHIGIIITRLEFNFFNNIENMKGELLELRPLLLLVVWPRVAWF